MVQPSITRFVLWKSWEFFPRRSIVYFVSVSVCGSRCRSCGPYVCSWWRLHLVELFGEEIPPSVRGHRRSWGRERLAVRFRYLVEDHLPSGSHSPLPVRGYYRSRKRWKPTWYPSCSREKVRVFQVIFNSRANLLTRLLIHFNIYYQLYLYNIDVRLWVSPVTIFGFK